MLKSILMVTLLALNLSQVEQAYRDELGYSVSERGVISYELAAGWDAPALGGQGYIILQPASGEPVYLRFIEDRTAADYRPMKTEGWNALEILVKDPDGLAGAFASSEHFRVVGKPRFLTEKRNIRAMQAIGPAGELIYFTNISDPEKSGFGLQPARTPVDRVFIMVVGARDLPALQGFYRDVLGMPVTPPAPYRIGVLSEAYQLPAETLHQLSVVQLSNRFLIELDEYPAAALPLRRRQRSLPPGIAMVSFEVAEWRPDLPYPARPGRRADFPYQGRRTGTLRGAAGEYIELVERNPRE